MPHLFVSLSPRLSLLFFFQSYGDHRDLHSFPTRRSSDLGFPRCPNSRGSVIGEFTVVLHRNLAQGHRSGANEGRSEEHTSELQSHSDLVCRLLLEKKKKRSKKKQTREEHKRTLGRDTRKE